MKPIDISPAGFKYNVTYKITELNDFLRKAIADTMSQYKYIEAGRYVWGTKIAFESRKAAFTENPCVLIFLPNTGSGGIRNICIYKNSYKDFLKAVKGLKVVIDHETAIRIIAGYQKKIAAIEKAYGLEA